MQLNNRLAYTTTTNEVTAPVSMSGGNCAHFEIFLYSASTLNISVEGSNDAENWTELTAAVAKGAAGINVIDETSAKTAWMRLRYAGTSTTGTLATTVHVSDQ